jgi:hypothetical protein
MAKSFGIEVLTVPYILLKKEHRKNNHKNEVALGIDNNHSYFIEDCRNNELSDIGTSEIWKR